MFFTKKNPEKWKQTVPLEFKRQSEHSVFCFDMLSAFFVRSNIDFSQNSIKMRSLRFKAAQCFWNNFGFIGIPFMIILSYKPGNRDAKMANLCGK